MEYNVCSNCEAKDGRAGVLIQREGEKDSLCKNCSDTKDSGVITIHMNLSRTQKELDKTFSLIENI